MAVFLPLISDVRREAIATPAASSAAELMRFRVERRSIDISISLFTLDAAAWAIKARRLALQQNRQVAYGIDPLEEKSQSSAMPSLNVFFILNICRLLSCTNPAGMWMKACFGCIWRQCLAAKFFLKLPLAW
jgi:hypothetical protein